jgi:hypothetical protein
MTGTTCKFGARVTSMTGEVKLQGISGTIFFLAQLCYMAANCRGTNLATVFLWIVACIFARLLHRINVLKHILRSRNFISDHHSKSDSYLSTSILAFFKIGLL